jgi:hypothetical protein
MRRPNRRCISRVPTVVPRRGRMHVNQEPHGTVGSSKILPRQATQVLHFGAGSLWQFGLATVAVIKPVAVDKLLVRYLVDAHTEVVNVAFLRPIPSPTESASRHIPIDQHSSKVWARARQEEKLLAPLLEHSTRQDRARVARALNLSDRQIRRKLRRYEALRSVEAFLPFRRGPMLGSTQVNPEIERLMDEQIRSAFKVSPDVGVDDLLPIIAAAAAALELPAPGRSTLSRRLRAARRNVSLFPSSLRRELAKQRRPVRSRIETGAPLSVVEIDHTIADVHLIEAQTGATIGRPVLTMDLDALERLKKIKTLSADLKRERSKAWELSLLCFIALLFGLSSIVRVASTVADVDIRSTKVQLTLQTPQAVTLIPGELGQILNLKEARIAGADSVMPAGVADNGSFEIKAFIPKIKSEKQLSAEESAVRLQEIALPGKSLMKITVGVAYDGDLRGLTLAAVSGPNAVKVALGQVIPVESNANNSRLTQYGINPVRAEGKDLRLEFIPTNSDRELTVFRDIQVSRIDFKDGDHSTILGGNAYVMDGAGAGTTMRPSEQFAIQSDEPMLLRELTLTKGALKVRLSAQKAKTLSLGKAFL